MGLLDGIKNIITGKGADLVKNVGGIIDNLNLSPEEKEKLRQDILIETNRHEEAMTTLAQKEVEAHNTNTASARELGIKMQGDKPSWLAKNIAFLIDILISVVWAAFTAYLGGRAIRLITEQVDLTAVLSLYATVTAVFMTVINYHRGSTSGSKRKDDAIQSMMSKKE